MRTPTKTEQATLNYYDEFEVDSLYVMIGRATERDRGIQYSPKTAFEKGRAWFATNEKFLHKKICIDWQLCKKLAQHGWKADLASLLVTLADQIVGPTLGNIPPLLIISVLAKNGLKQFCGCTEKKRSR